MSDKRTKELIGELHALLRGDTDYQKTEGDVEFFDTGKDDTLIVDICGRRYLVMVKELEVSDQAAPTAAMRVRKFDS